MTEASKRSTRPALVAFALLAVATPSCKLFQPQDDPTRYYVLRGLEATDPGRKLTRGSGLILSVGPTTVPGYLDRTQIVTSDGANGLEVAEFHIWAEPLDRAAARVVSKNLSQLLDTPDVAPYPDIDLLKYDYRVGILFNRFEATPAGAVVLEATWAFGGMPGADIKTVSRTTRLEVPVQGIQDATEQNPGADHSAIADSMGKALNELSVQIARVILSRGKPKPPSTDD